MPRIEKALDLTEDIWNTLERLKSALGHEDLEETMSTLVNLGWAAIAVSTAAQRKVTVSGNDRTIGDPCVQCGQRRVVRGKEQSVVIGKGTA